MELRRKILVMIMALGIGTICASGADAPPSDVGRAKSIIDFEDASIWKSENNSPFEVSTEHVTQGKKSLKVNYTNKPEWSNILTDKMPADWTGFRYLNVDVFLEGQLPAEFGIWIRDKAFHKAESSFILGPGANTLTIDLDDLKNRLEFDRGNVIAMCLYKNSKEEITVYLDNMCVSEKAPVLPGKAPDVAEAEINAATVAQPQNNRGGPGAADVTGTAQWLGGAWRVLASTPQGALDFSLQIAGRHNVKNALAATACALAAGAPLAAISAGLSAFVPVKGRSRALQLQAAGHALTLIDDSYNANPDSVRAAIDVLAELPGPRLLVLGDMGEVGDQGPAFHVEVGAHARERGIEQVFTLGAQSADAASAFGGGRHFGDDIEALKAAVMAALPGVSSVLVKGSRFMKMERVVQAIVADTQQQKEERQ